MATYKSPIPTQDMDHLVSVLAECERVDEQCRVAKAILDTLDDEADRLADFYVSELKRISEKWLTQEENKT